MGIKQVFMDRTGERKISNQGYQMIIEKYYKSTDISIKFIDTGVIVNNKTYAHFKNGNINNPDHIKEYTKPNKHRIGERNISTQGCEMIIVDYINKNSVSIKFLDDHGYVFENSRYGDFKSGSIKNPYFKNICKTGYIGVGIYNRTDHFDMYNHFTRLHTRVSSDQKCYKDVTVGGGFEDFQFFCDWFIKNKHGECDHILDKDILTKGKAKIYSPDTCVLVPVEINQFFVVPSKIRRDINGVILPTGVVMRNNKYSVKARVFDGYDGNGKVITIEKRLGTRDTIEEAFGLYAKNKQELLIIMADHHKENISQSLWDICQNYDFSIESWTPKNNNIF